MDIFDVLAAISEKKMALVHSGMNEHEAMEKAKIDISIDYHIPLIDVKKLAGESRIRRRQRLFFQVFSPSSRAAVSPC